MSQSSTNQKSQSSLNSFFKPVLPASRSVTPSSQTTQPAIYAPSKLPQSMSTSSRKSSTDATVTSSTNPRPSTASSQQSFTSSLSPPPTSPIEYDGRIFDIPISPPKPPFSSSAVGRVVKSSDDEEDDSDSSLEDLNVLLQTRRPNGTAFEGGPHSMPSSSRVSKPFLTSPIPLLSKTKFDLKSLASHAENDRKTEASLKRIKVMQETTQKKENLPPQLEDTGAKLKHSELLQSVVAEQERGDIGKVVRAVRRTEATLAEQSWYFFDTQPNPPKPPPSAFPTKALSEEWKSDLKDGYVRQQTFVSGFAEDMVGIGKLLPDEILLWLLDEICVVSSEALRVSYCNVLKASGEQIRRLIHPSIIQRMFERLGASSTTIEVTCKAQPVPALGDPYSKRDWAKLRSVVRFLGQIAEYIQARTLIVSQLLRMSIDRLVLENVDIFDAVEYSIQELCKYIPDSNWESCCQQICATLFQSVDPPTFRLQTIQCIPSFTPRTHDLKRRLAMCFFFNDITYSSQHAHHLLDLDKFIDRLEDTDFDTNSQTDYRDLGALISLLNVAVDDGINVNVDLRDPMTEKVHDENIEILGSTIKDIMKGIGNPGAAYISRIEAKEVLDLVGHRILDTLRCRPKARTTVFDRKVESLDGEKKGMERFVSKASNGAGPASQ